MSKRINIKGRGKSLPFGSRPKKISWWSFIDDKKEMVSPYMGFNDSRLLNKKVLADVVAYFLSHIVVNTPTQEGIVKKLLPSHLICDIYSLYYNPSSEHEYAVIDDSNRGKWNLLTACNDSSVKIITNNNSISSLIFTSEICKAIIAKAHAALPPAAIKQLGELLSKCKAEKKQDEDGEDEGDPDSNDNSGGSQPQDSKEGDSPDGDGYEDGESEDGEGESSNGGNQSSDKGSEGDGSNEKVQGNDEQKEGEYSQGAGNTSEGSPSNSKNNNKAPKTSLEELCDKIIGGSFQEMLASAKSQAFSRISEFEKSGISIREIHEYSKGSSMLDIVEQLDDIKAEALQITTSAPSLRKILSSIIDKSTSYFSENYTAESISIFESDEINDLMGVENFHPLLEAIAMDEIETTETKYKGKVNIYVDVSGSMDSEVKYNGAYVKNITFAKSLIIKMMQMGIVDKVIPFGNVVYSPLEPLTMISVLMLQANSGTCIDAVVNDCERLQENGIIVTDCQDHINVYSNKCFIMGTPDAKLRLSGPANQFKGSQQIWKFNDDNSDIVELSV